MEKKPIKRNEHIVKLSKDHHFTLLFCWKIRNGLKFEIEPGRIEKYVQYFWQHHLQPHFKEEETILFAPVKDAAVQKALDEHAQITQQINTLPSAGNNLADQLSILAGTVDNHVRYEERELFPHLEKVLTNEQLETIGKQIAAQNDPTLKDDFADEFWLKKKD
ncbi:hemerythrin domain-containing protein [Segetibacter koreensis]|uniref:hemerythrin domain-containing protein n=1 Tax=Segetibacter koreensis TaxID=398037 RepID=UPI000361CFA9|nr:hemerythrin domain-containing protein [Segetibacter koreensis]